VHQAPSGKKTVDGQIFCVVLCVTLFFLELAHKITRESTAVRASQDSKLCVDTILLELEFCHAKSKSIELFLLCFLISFAIERFLAPFFPPHPPSTWDHWCRSIRIIGKGSGGVAPTTIRFDSFRSCRCCSYFFRAKQCARKNPHRQPYLQGT